MKAVMEAVVRSVTAAAGIGVAEMMPTAIAHLHDHDHHQQTDQSFEFGAPDPVLHPTPWR